MARRVVGKAVVRARVAATVRKVVSCILVILVCLWWWRFVLEVLLDGLLEVRDDCEDDELNFGRKLEVLYRYREVLVTPVVLFFDASYAVWQGRPPVPQRNLCIRLVTFLIFEWNHAARSVYENTESTCLVI